LGLLGAVTGSSATAGSAKPTTPATTRAEINARMNFSCLRFHRRLPGYACQLRSSLFLCCYDAGKRRASGAYHLKAPPQGKFHIGRGLYHFGDRRLVSASGTRGSPRLISGAANRGSRCPGGAKRERGSRAPPYSACRGLKACRNTRTLRGAPWISARA
jgi:hypothetical protein